MRRTIVWSVLGHGAAFGVLSRCDAPTDHASAHVPAPPRQQIEPVEIVVLDETSRGVPMVAPEAGEHAALVPTRAPDVRRERAATIDAPASHRDATAGARREPAITTGDPRAEVPRGASKLLQMRGPDLALSRDAAERIAAGAKTGGETAGESRWAFDPKIKIVPDGGGTHEVRDRVATFHIAADGTVDIEREPDVTVKVTIPNPWKMAKTMVQGIAVWAENPYRDRDVGRMQDLPKHLTAVEGACESSADSMCITSEDWQLQWQQEDALVAAETVVSGKLDLTAWLHRKLVGDPYASRKLKILDQTRDQRVRIGEQYRADQRDRSSELVQRNLERLWASTPDPAQRRTALFEIWDECTEDEPGRRARAMVIGWIRGKLGEPYTAEELRELNARRSSQQRFEP